MAPKRVHGMFCALLLVLAGTAQAGEPQATPVCGRSRSCYAGRRCYDPCQPVGPVRRFLRRVFLPRCPPPCPAPCPPAVTVVPAPRPAVFLPPAVPPVAPAPPPPPPANLDRPAPVPAAPPAPLAPSAPFPSAGAAYRTPYVVPSPPPVRVDRIASLTRRWCP